MMKKWILTIILCFVVPVNAELVIIEADDYPAATDLGPYFPQFSFIACGPAYNTIYATESIHGYGQLGTNVIGCFWDDYWTYPAQLHIKIKDRHAKSISLLVHESTEAEGSVYVWLRVRSSPSNLIIEEAFVQAPNTDHPPAILSITRDDYDIARAEIYMGNGGDSICLDHIEILLNPKQVLTVQTEPNFVDTVDPNAGEHICHLNEIVDLSASDYPICPNSYTFDHWEGDVRSPNQANTLILMDANEIVMACFVPIEPICGDICHPILPPDLNEDCWINLADFAIWARQYLGCTHPDCD